MTPPEDLRLPETPPDVRRRLAEIVAEQSRLAIEAQRLIAGLSAEPERVADRDTVADRPVDAPTPRDLIALKSASHIWGRSDRSMKKLASDHGALHRVGGRLMVDAERLRAGVFGHVFPLSS